MLEERRDGETDLHGDKGDDDREQHEALHVALLVLAFRLELHAHDGDGGDESEVEGTHGEVHVPPELDPLLLVQLEEEAAHEAAQGEMASRGRGEGIAECAGTE